MATLSHDMYPDIRMEVSDTLCLKRGGQILKLVSYISFGERRDDQFPFGIEVMPEHPIMTIEKLVDKVLFERYEKEFWRFNSTRH
jgi:hypothetical protein